MTDIKNENTAPAGKKPTTQDIFTALQNLTPVLANINSRLDAVEASRAAMATQVQQVQPSAAVAVIGGPQDSQVQVLEETQGPVTTVAGSSDLLRGNSCPCCGTFERSTPNPVVVTKDTGSLKAGNLLPPGEKLAEHIKSLKAGDLVFICVEDDPTIGIKKGQRFTLSGEQLLGIVTKDKKRMSYGLSGLLTGNGGHPAFKPAADHFRYAQPQEKRPFWLANLKALASRLVG